LVGILYKDWYQTVFNSNYLQMGCQPHVEKRRWQQHRNLDHLSSRGHRTVDVVHCKKTSLTTTTPYMRTCHRYIMGNYSGISVYKYTIPFYLYINIW
jgi:hypothetical protein